MNCRRNKGLLSCNATKIVGMITKENKSSTANKDIMIDLKQKAIDYNNNIGDDSSKQGFNASLDIKLMTERVGDAL